MGSAARWEFGAGKSKTTMKMDTRPPDLAYDLVDSRSRDTSMTTAWTEEFVVQVDVKA